MDYAQLFFETKVYGVCTLINLDLVSMLLGIVCPSADAIFFPNQGIDKAQIFELFKWEGTSWFGKWHTTECSIVARVLDITLVDNLLQTTYKTTMTDDKAHLVTSLMEGKSIDVLTIMCHIMLQTSIEDGIKRGLSYEVLVTQLLE